MHSIVVWTISVVNVISLVFNFAANKGTKDFLKSTPAINNTVDMCAFKSYVSRQMHLALVYLPIALITTVTYVVLLFAGFFTGPEKFFFLAQFVIMWISGSRFKKDEVRARMLPVGDQELREERDKIAEIWKKKPLPTW